MALNVLNAWTASGPRPSLGRPRASGRGLAAQRWPRPSWSRTLTWALGSMWLLDAALQFQPYMFTRAFPREAIAPAGMGSPGWVQGPVMWASSLMAGHILLLNSVFALVQLMIALALFWPRTVKLGLAGSAVWALLVWWMGEGLGAVLSGPVSPLAGFPGAVVLYALIAFLVWPRPVGAVDSSSSGTAARSGPLRGQGAVIAWLVLWLGFAAETLRAANRAPRALHDVIAGAASGEPPWIAHIDGWASGLVAGHGFGISMALAVCFGLIALSVLVPGAARLGVGLAVVISLAMWVVVQDFGEIFTGQGTDPNSGLPLILLALCYWPIATRPSGEQVPEREREVLHGP